ncbi:MAG: hypothetical protein ABSC13_04985 [Dehalococcoidia bacterium]|jgi:hypothetical protein
MENDRLRRLELQLRDPLGQKAALEARLAQFADALRELSPSIEDETLHLAALEREAFVADLLYDAARERAEADWDSIAASLGVERLYYSRKAMVVTTAPVIIQQRLIGRFAVHIPRYAASIAVKNLDQALRAGKSVIDHPHVVASKPQWPELQFLAALLAKEDPPSFVLSIVARLGRYDPLTAACPIDAWPLVGEEPPVPPAARSPTVPFARGRDAFVSDRAAEQLMAVRNLKGEVKTLRAKLGNEMRRAEAALREYKAAYERLAAIRGLPGRDPAALAAEWDVIESDPVVASLRAHDGKIVLATHTIQITHRGERYLLGPFLVTITPRLILVKSSGPRPGGCPHPHVSAAGEPCFGNVSQLMRNALGEGQFTTVLTQMLEFLRSYSSAAPYVSIEEFPRA